MTAIKKIVIAGGSLEGWMSAAYLNKALNSENRRVEITLIESAVSTPIEVGESTTLMIHGFFNFLGIPEQAWMEACQATYRIAKQFKNWYDNGPEDSYWHTIGSINSNGGARFSLIHHWLHNWKTGKTDLSFAKAVSESVYLCESNKCPVKAFSETPIKGVPYSYHIDGEKLVAFLKDLSLASGVVYESQIMDVVKKDTNGCIASLRTKEGTEITGDLFLDCTGSESLLLEKEMGALFHSYADALICDKILTTTVDYTEDDPYNEKSEGLKPYTTATAMDAGWSWKIPLITRSAYGYVYSSTHVTDDAAEESLRAILPEKGAQSEIHSLPFRTGTMDKHWIRNCIGVGRSTGFIEPMESTNLALIQSALQNLLFHFPNPSFPDFRIDGFNSYMSALKEEIYDFIVLHYTLTKREDTSFWKSVRNDIKVPSAVTEKLLIWKDHWQEFGINNNFFGVYNYVSILTGMNHLPEKSHDFLEYYMIEDTFQRFQKVMIMGQNMVNQLDSQAAYFKKIKRIKEYQNRAF